MKQGISRNSRLFINVTKYCICTDTVQEIYNASNAVRSAIPHPRIMGVIKECGGKMWMGERQYGCLTVNLSSQALTRTMESSQRRFLRVFPQLR
jgi:hypothetical protein